VCLGLKAFAQDWYPLPERGMAGSYIRTRQERKRLQRTKQELAELEGKLEHGGYDEHELYDVIDSIKISANDDRLSSRDRDVLADNLHRLRHHREHHEHWNR
jgi:hypothetical protein